jgi:hypothetical protein
VEIAEQLRLYPLYTADSVLVYDPPPTVPQALEETIQLYLRMYQRFIAENTLSSRTKHLVQQDIIRQTARLLLKKPYSHRAAYLWENRQQLPLFLKTSPLLLTLLLLNQRLYHLLVTQTVGKKRSLVQQLTYKQLVVD